MTTVCKLATNLLCVIDYYEDIDRNIVKPCAKGARSVGIPYAKILKHILKKIPTANTKVKCLRWYASRIRSGDMGDPGQCLPQRRPRPGEGWNG